MLKTSIFLSALALSSISFAQETKPEALTIDQAARIAAAPGAVTSALTKFTGQPVTFEISLKGKSYTYSGDPDEFAKQVRALSDPIRYKAGNYSYIKDWKLLRQENGPVIFDFIADVKENIVDKEEYMSDDGGDVYSEMKLVSIVGPIVSLRVNFESYSPGAAHPNSDDNIYAYDMRKQTTDRMPTANLMELVEEASLVNALKQDKYLLSQMGPKNKAKLIAAKTMAAAAEAIDAALEPKCYNFPFYENRIMTFAISGYDVAKNLMGVRVTISAAAHACAGEADTKQLGLLVTPKPDFKQILIQQVRNKDGLFAK
jgi:hypothetical protein